MSPAVRPPSSVVRSPVSAVRSRVSFRVYAQLIATGEIFELHRGPFDNDPTLWIIATQPRGLRLPGSRPPRFIPPGRGHRSSPLSILGRRSSADRAPAFAP